MKPIVICALLFGLVAGSAMAQRLLPPTDAELAMIEASLEGQLDVVKQQVASGISVHALDLEKRTALMWASFNGHTPVVAFLIAHGAKVDAKDENGRTALLYASSGPFVETVELLLKSGANVNCTGTLEGFTAIMTAAAEGQIEVVRLLLKHGANPNIVDKDGDTAESFARQKGHPDVEALLKGLSSAENEKP